MDQKVEVTCSNNSENDNPLLGDVNRRKKSCKEIFRTTYKTCNFEHVFFIFCVGMLNASLIFIDLDDWIAFFEVKTNKTQAQNKSLKRDENSWWVNRASFMKRS